MHLRYLAIFMVLIEKSISNLMYFFLIDAVIDTGFTDFLTLPLTIITSLNLQLYSREEVTLGNGSVGIFDVYPGFVIWDGEFKRIDINAAETLPLMGMNLLYGYRMQLDAIANGKVTIQSLRSLS